MSPIWSTATESTRPSQYRVLDLTDSRAELASFVLGPNPAAAEVRARIVLTAPASVRCRLFTLEGEVVREAERAGLAGTIVEIPIDLRGLASGTYLAQFELSTGGRRVRTLAVRR